MGKKLVTLGNKLGIKKQNLIFIAGLVGILLIAFAKLPGSWSDAPGESGPQAEVKAMAETGSYEKELEQRLETILGSIAGVGRVRVMVTLESGYGYEYAKENRVDSDRLSDIKADTNEKIQEKSTSEESYVMVDTKGGGKEPLITKELEPRVQGVVVVCDGGSNPAVISNILETVGVAVKLSSAEISVSRMDSSP